MATLRKFGEGEKVESPQLRKKTSTLGKVGEFLAPTTTQAIRGLKEGEKPTLRQVGGAALEIGSLAIPATAAARVAGVVGRGAKAVAGIARGRKTETQLEKLGQVATRTGRATRAGAEIGAVSGGLAGAGRALGDEDKTVGQVAKEGLIGATIGGVGGAVLGLGGSLTVQAIKGTKDAATRGFRAINNQLNPTKRKAAVDDVSKSILDSYVEDKGAVLKGLDKLAEKSRFFGDDVTPDTLIREMIDEGGYIPEIRGSVGRFTAGIKDAGSRRGEIRQLVTERADKIIERTTTESLRKASQQNLAGRTDVDVIKAERQLNTLFKGFQKEFGDVLTGKQVNIIREKMNQQGGESFTKVVQNSIGRASRSILDKLDPEIRTLNAESGRLARITDTMKILDNKKIDAGFWSGAIGRYLGTVFGGAALAAVALGSAGAAGGLVIAGILANVGARGVAKMIRQTRFNPQLRDILRQGFRSDKKLINKLKKEASEEDAALIDRLLLEEKSSAAIPLRGEVDLGKQTPRGINP